MGLLGKGKALEPTDRDEAYTIGRKAAKDVNLEKEVLLLQVKGMINEGIRIDNVNEEITDLKRVVYGTGTPGVAGKTTN